MKASGELQMSTNLKIHLAMSSDTETSNLDQRWKNTWEFTTEVHFSSSPPPPKFSGPLNLLLYGNRMLILWENCIVLMILYCRYVKALRSLLIEKVERLGVDVPPLCSCGENIWDTHPDLCANNCPFYKNPKGMILWIVVLRSPCIEKYFIFNHCKTDLKTDRNLPT